MLPNSPCWPQLRDFLKKAWERQIFHGFVQAPFEAVPCCRFFIPTEHPQFPKIAQFPARPAAWAGISVPNSSLLSPLDSASGGIADGFRAELPGAFQCRWKRRFFHKGKAPKKSPNPLWSGLKSSGRAEQGLGRRNFPKGRVSMADPGLGMRPEGGNCGVNGF